MSDDEYARLSDEAIKVAYRVGVDGDGDNSTRKFGVEFFRKPDGALWIKCRFCSTPTVWIPSLRDLHRVIQAIAWCEDDKYPPPAQGRALLIPFFRDVVRDPQWARLAAKYKIPDRVNDVVTNPNGADLSGRRRTTEWPTRPADNDLDDRWIEESDKRRQP